MPVRSDLRFFWVLCLIVAPPLLILIELFHPANFTVDPGMFDYLRAPQSPGGDIDHRALDYFGPNWWFWLHMTQTPAVVLISAGLMLSVATFIGRAAAPLWPTVSGWAAIAALFVFLVYYTVLDAIGGIGLGRMLETVNLMQGDGRLNPDQVAGIAVLLNAIWVDPWVGGVGSVVSMTGSWAIFIAAVLAAITAVLALGFAGMSALRWLSLVLLIAGGWYVQLSHACCTGPIGFGLIFGFGCLTAWADRNLRDLD